MRSRLTEKQERLLLLFKQGIQREQDTQAFYADMLENCEDPKLKQIIESLRKSEQKHEELLMEKYAELREIAKQQEV